METLTSYPVARASGLIVTLDTRQRKDDTRIDWDDYAARWDATLGGGQLASAAPAVSSLRDPASRRPAPGSDGDQPAPEVLARTARTAVAMVQARKSTWTRADLLKQVGLAMPAEARAMNPEAAVTLLHALADRALAGSSSRCLRRELDGRWSTRGQARSATQPESSFPSRSSSSSRPSEKARHGWTARSPRNTWAQTRACWRRSY